MLNLAIILEESARSVPQKTAFILDTVELTYQQLNQAANQVACALKDAGIQKGDKVALSCPNLPYFPIVYYGILKAGAVVVPLNVLLKSREVAYHLNDSDAKAYFCFQGTAELPMGETGFKGFQKTEACEHFFMITANPDTPSPIPGTATLHQLIEKSPPEFDSIQTQPQDTAVILYTSGTTGQSKGAELTHFNLFFNAISANNLNKGMGGDRVLNVLPLFHSFGQTVLMNATVYAGGTSVLLPRFDPDESLRLFQDKSITLFAGVPTMYWAILNATNLSNFDISKISGNLRLCSSGGAAMPVEVLRQFEAKFDVAILEGYGLSETSPVASFNRLDKERKVGSIGLPIWGVEMKVFDEHDNEVPVGESGEIVIRGHNIMKGYYQRPEANAQVMRGGWFHSGDVGKMDEDGYFYIVDRTKDMIIRGGFNVYPREIEEVLITHPAVSLAAVIGVPDEQYGEEIKAFVILNEPESINEDQLIKWSKENMADYKYPRFIEFRETLPMTATGKILKNELRKE